MRAHTSSEEEGGVVTRSRTKKQRTNDLDEKEVKDITAEFEEFCKGVPNHLTVMEMRKILEANDQDPSGPDDAVIPRV